MNPRILASIAVVVTALGGLIYAAVGATSASVVTVTELIARGETRRSVQLGARVADKNIEVRTTPDFELRFRVRDIVAGETEGEAVPIGEVVPVLYRGVKPDTLKAGRDVILEGDFVVNPSGQKEFIASDLKTKCPSKYEPPVPGAASAPSEMKKE